MLKTPLEKSRCLLVIAVPAVSVVSESPVAFGHFGGKGCFRILSLRLFLNPNIFEKAVPLPERERLH